jgi:hypothetical protein
LFVMCVFKATMAMAISNDLCFVASLRSCCCVTLYAARSRITSDL